MTENKTKWDKNGEPKVRIDQSWMIHLEQSRLVPFPTANPLLFFKKNLPHLQPSPPPPQNTCICLLLQATTCSPIHPSASMASSTTSMAVHAPCRIHATSFIPKGVPHTSKKYNENEEKEVVSLLGPSPQQGSTFFLSIRQNTKWT